jgi:hypothetical protein
MGHDECCHYTTYLLPTLASRPFTKIPPRGVRFLPFLWILTLFSRPFFSPFDDLQIEDGIIDLMAFLCTLYRSNKTHGTAIFHNHAKMGEREFRISGNLAI